MIEKFDFKVQIDKWENTFFLKIFLFCYQKKVLKNYLSKKNKTKIPFHMNGNPVKYAMFAKRFEHKKTAQFELFLIIYTRKDL